MTWRGQLHWTKPKICTIEKGKGVKFINFIWPLSQKANHQFLSNSRPLRTMHLVFIWLLILCVIDKGQAFSDRTCYSLCSWSDWICWACHGIHGTPPSQSGGTYHVDLNFSQSEVEHFLTERRFDCSLVFADGLSFRTVSWVFVTKQWSYDWHKWHNAACPIWGEPLIHKL